MLNVFAILKGDRSLHIFTVCCIIPISLHYSLESVYHQKMDYTIVIPALLLITGHTAFVLLVISWRKWRKEVKRRKVKIRPVD